MLLLSAAEYLMSTTRERAKAYAEKWHLGGPSCGYNGNPREAPSADALLERDRVLALPRTITEKVCGDPLPGRSALDHKRRENLKV